MRIVLPVACCLALAGVALAAAALPGWRHRHVGEVGHTHSHPHGQAHSHGHGHAHPHSHGHGHAHPHGHAHSHDQATTAERHEGWHQHVSLFGWELTIWEPGWLVAADAADDEAKADSKTPSPRAPHTANVTAARHA